MITYKMIAYKMITYKMIAYEMVEHEMITYKIISYKNIYMCHKQTFMQRIIAKAIGGIKLSDVQMDEIIKCGAKGGCIMSGMMSL